MKKLIPLLLVGLITFGASAFLSWKWQASGAAPAVSGDQGSGHEPTTELGPERTTARTGKQGQPASHASAGSSRASAEEVIPLLENLQKQRAALRQKETQFNARQRQLDLIYQSIRDERAAMEKLVQEFRDELREMEEQTKAPVKPKPHPVMSPPPSTATSTFRPLPTSRAQEVKRPGISNVPNGPDLRFLHSLHAVLRNLFGSDVVDCAVSIFYKLHDPSSTRPQGS
jgi:hypothetical protein